MNEYWRKRYVADVIEWLDFRAYLAKNGARRIESGADGCTIWWLDPVDATPADYGWQYR